MSAISDRYQRNLLCEGFSENTQELITAAKVVVVGSGGLGGYVLTQLAAIGVGNIGIVEFDEVSISNLNRQILFSTDDVGSSKIDCAKKRLNGLNPEVNYTLFNTKLDSDNGEKIISQYDIVVDCTDNYTVRYDMDRICQKLQKPLVHASVEGMRGVVTTFTYQNELNYRTLYGEKELKKSTPPGVLSPIVGVVGSYQASEVVKLITNQGEPLIGKLLTVDLLKNQTQIFELSL